MNKNQKLQKLYNEYRDKFEGQEIVLGDGNADAKLILIGEAPGKDEVKLSKPFVGVAGKNLNEFLSLLGIAREDIYITNAIKYRLSEVNEQTGRLVNRPAIKEEIDGNRSYLLREIEIINPEIIVTLGNVPLKSVTGESSMSIGKVHGQLRKVTVIDNEYGLFPLYHPASIIYNRSLKDIYNKDIISLKEQMESKNDLKTAYTGNI